MARFGVYRHPEGKGYLLDIQADLLRHLNTRVVVPLLPLDIAPKPAKTLNPVFENPGYSAMRQRIASGELTFVLLPSLMSVKHQAVRHDVVTDAGRCAEGAKEAAQRLDAGFRFRRIRCAGQLAHEAAPGPWP